MTNNLKSLTVREFLSNDNYVIPIYQRNYDWGEKEVLQLIEDIADYAKDNPEKNYYIGSAVVYSKSANGNAYFELIDGQQRLTTLSILTTLIFNEKESFGISPEDNWYKQPNISFDYRTDSDDALKMIRNDKNFDKKTTSNIVDVYKIFKKNLKIISGKQLELKDFADYLFNKVIIVRISVPEDTDLNHYFEIMNTRGEQLEKHEVLKAKLMSHLDESEHILFNTIWEACSDMFSYVQMNFTLDNRNKLFNEDKDWNTLCYYDFDSINTIFNGKERVSDNNIEKTIAELLDDAKSNKKTDLPNNENKKEEQERFESIINFPNFLLHVLKIMYRFWDGYDEKIHEEIKLDDKRLLQIFYNVIDSESVKKDRKSFIKKFIVELLKLRLLFDRYVIKREYTNKSDKERWSLKALKRYEKSKVNYVNTFSADDSDESDVHKDIRMLEAMFHVSAPTLIYKHWLNAVLYYVYKQETVNPENMRNTLYQLATTYMSDIYLNEDTIDFETIIYKNNFESKNEKLCWGNINKGCDVANFIFNYYDYIVWKNDPNKYPKFEFSYRTSVEHFYPQNPMSGYENLAESEDNKKRYLNNFGNLCLISRTMNSKFGNNMPKAKLENFGNIEEVRNGLSIKLLEMMEKVRVGEWGKKEIKEFGDTCKTLIKETLEQQNKKVLI